MDTVTNPVAFLRSLKGAPLSVLIAIRIFPGPASLLQLAAATGYDQHTCAHATQALEAMGLLERAHYRAWRLTTAAQQLPLWTPGEVDTVEPDDIAPDDPALLESPKRENYAFQAPATAAPTTPDALKRENYAFQPPATAAPTTPDALKRENYAFQAEPAPSDALNRDAPKGAHTQFQPAAQGGGGSSLINAREEDLKPPPPRDDRPKREKYAFQPDDEELLAALVDLTGCPRRRAEQAVAAARTAGYYTSWMHLQVLRWHAYLADGRGKNLNNPGYFVAKKLEDGEPCPSDVVRNGHVFKARELEWRWEEEQQRAESLAPAAAAAEADHD